MTDVRTRFAPSPTGYMHIGGMRTALFNWLWARHTGGKFILRIDDTDRQRNVAEALEPILHAFRWLNLDWDEGPEVGGQFGPYFQSERGPLYQQAADRLLAEGKAFRDFDPPELTRADREAAEKEKRPYLNIRRSLELNESEIEQKLQAGEPYVVRYLVNRGETVAVDDAIRGHVEWETALMPDPVIMRADGSPLYNFATVVDDAAMRISHVIRAEEHLSNTPVQILLHQALGHDLPQFAHIPYVAAPGSKEKLSKRHKQLEKYRKSPQFQKLFQIADEVLPQIGLGSSETLNPVMVEYYERAGFLPEAVLNALARLGWSYDDKTEFMPRPFIVENFTLDRVIKSPAGFDPDKLMSYQAHWAGALPLEEKVERCLAYLVKAGLVRGTGNGNQGTENGKPAWQAVGFEQPQHVDDETRKFVTRLAQALGERLVLFSDILSYREFFVADDTLEYDEKAFDKRLRAPGAAELLTKFSERLRDVEPFDAQATEAAMKSFAEAEGVKLAEIIHPVRLSVTGKPAGPGMFDCLELLGRTRCLARIERALSRVG